jgi:hypothetical protein
VGGIEGLKGATAVGARVSGSLPSVLASIDSTTVTGEAACEGGRVGGSEGAKLG